MRIHATITSTTEPTPPPVRRYVGWRGLHETEGGRIPTQEIPSPPAVIPPYNPTVALEMTESIQWMSYDLMKHFCDAASGQRWRILHRVGIAMNNGDANGYDGSIAHRDYVNGLDLKAVKLNGSPDLPRYDKMQRTFQGSFITGKLGYSVMIAFMDALRLVRQTILAPRKTARTFRSSVQSLSSNNIIWCTPGVDAIDAKKPMPSVETIIDKNWYSVAVCAANPPFHFRGQWGSGCVIVYPFILDRPISFEAKFFTSWDETFLPDPIKVYL